MLPLSRTAELHAERDAGLKHRAAKIPKLSAVGPRYLLTYIEEKKKENEKKKNETTDRSHCPHFRHAKKRMRTGRERQKERERGIQREARHKQHRRKNVRSVTRRRPLQQRGVVVLTRKDRQSSLLYWNSVERKDRT